MKNEHPRRPRWSSTSDDWPAASDESSEATSHDIADDDGDSATEVIDQLEAGDLPPGGVPLSVLFAALFPALAPPPESNGAGGAMSPPLPPREDRVMQAIRHRQAALREGRPRVIGPVSPPGYDPAAPQRWWRRAWWSWNATIRAFASVSVTGVTIFFLWWTMFDMPGEAPAVYRTFTAVDEALQTQLTRRVYALAVDIGPRNVEHPWSYRRAAQYIHGEMFDVGYRPSRQTFTVTDAALGLDRVECDNVIVELPGQDLYEEIVVVGVHYDSIGDSPGANDNASGVAAAMSVAQRWMRRRPRRTVRFVFFANGADPWRSTPHMGSEVYARSCRAAGDNIVAMIAIDGLGYYRDSAGSQSYPMLLDPLYPSTGDFVAFIGNQRSRLLTRSSILAFRFNGGFAAEGITGWEWMPFVRASDHRHFWDQGYEGFLVTDTGPYRNPWYGPEHDEPGVIDFERLARATDAFEKMLIVLCNR